MPGLTLCLWHLLDQLPQFTLSTAVGVDQKTITNWEDGFRKLSAVDNFLNFDPPIYNIWKQQTKTDGVSHFGNSEVRWLENLMYLYTEPADIVVDPFAVEASFSQTINTSPASLGTRER